MRDDEFSAILAAYPRLAIAGGPKTGKTTLTASIEDRPVLHTDETMHLPWADQWAIWIPRLELLPRFLVEGVQVARCLRRGLAVDGVVFLGAPLRALTPDQEALRKGVSTVFREWASRASTPVFYL